jgi:hypothetical protein
LRECRHDAVSVAGELGDDPNPIKRSSTAEVPLASRPGIWLAVIGFLNHGHRLYKVLAHLVVLIHNMIPCHVVHLDEMALGIANLGDDVQLSDGAKATGEVVDDLRAGPTLRLEAGESVPWGATLREKVSGETSEKVAICSEEASSFFCMASRRSSQLSYIRAASRL